MPKAKPDASNVVERVDRARALLGEIRDGLLPKPHATSASLGKLRAVGPLVNAPQPIATPFTPPAKSAEKPATAPGRKGDKAALLSELRAKALACTRCPHLVASRTQVVFGVGNPNADILFVGEAPGADEDLQGEPFVGRAGQLLSKIIEAMGFQRSDIYIANVLKCRPDMPPDTSGNRKPKPEEMRTCLPWLKEQIAIIRPRAMVALGATAVEGLLETAEPMRDLRGNWREFEGIPVMVTYHPAYLLRNQTITEKRKVWEDMLKVMERLELPISTKQRAFFLSK